jgi:predicted nucleotidyltransferase
MFRPPRDHDIVVDWFGRHFVVVGNLHPPNKLVAYLKYIPTYEKTLWCYGGTYYRRVLKTYGVKSLHKYLSDYQELTFDPVFNALVPTVGLSSIATYYYPELRLKEMFSRVNDVLELITVEFVDTIRDYTSINYDHLGVTGSLLTKIHNVDVSDIDLVVYGCREALEFMGCIGNYVRVKPTTEELIKQSQIYGVPTDVLVRINTYFKRFLFRGREVNVIFVDDSQQRYGSEAYLSTYPVELVVDVVSGDCRALQYPGMAVVEKVVDVLGGRLGSDVVGSLRYVVSYEGIFSYPLYLGGRLRVRGLLQRVVPTNEYRVLVGGIEEPGYVIPLEVSERKSNH